MMVRRRTLTHSLFATAVLAVGLTGCGAMPPSNQVALSATLSGANEVPAVASTGTGMAEAWLNKDTNLLTWKVTFSGLTGPATAGHFHGPAAAGSNAGVVVPFAGTTSPLEGQTTLTPAQATDLLAGKWYANIHTATHKGGEIRGQMQPKM
jgi:hypothetical protein